MNNQWTKRTLLAISIQMIVTGVYAAPETVEAPSERIFLKILKIILKIVRRPSLNKHN